MKKKKEKKKIFCDAIKKQVSEDYCTPTLRKQGTINNGPCTICPNNPEIRKSNKQDIIYCYTYRLPKGEYDLDDLSKFPAHVNSLEIKDQKTATLLDMRYEEFKREKNPVYALEAFLLSHKAGLYPPEWTVEFMAEAFEEYHTQMGKKELDLLMGFKGRGKKGNAFQRLLEEERNENLINDMFSLTILGYTVPQAAKMVYQKLQQTENWNKTRFHLIKPKVSTIERMYRRISKTFNRDIFIEIRKEYLRKNKKKLLSTFPESAILPLKKAQKK